MPLCAGSTINGGKFGVTGLVEAQTCYPYNLKYKETGFLLLSLSKGGTSLVKDPTNPFQTLELQNPSYDVSHLHKTRRSPEREALKL